MVKRFSDCSDQTSELGRNVIQGAVVLWAKCLAIQIDRTAHTCFKLTGGRQGLTYPCYTSGTSEDTFE